MYANIFSITVSIWLDNLLENGVLANNSNWLIHLVFEICLYCIFPVREQILKKKNVYDN